MVLNIYLANARTNLYNNWWFLVAKDGKWSPLFSYNRKIIKKLDEEDKVFTLGYKVSKQRYRYQKTSQIGNDKRIENSWEIAGKRRKKITNHRQRQCL